MRIILNGALAIVLLAGAPALAQSPASSQAQQAPNQAQGEQKAQQNSADEAAVRGTFEAAQDPDDAAKRRQSNQKLEDAAGDAQRGSNSTGAGGSAGGMSTR